MPKIAPYAVSLFIVLFALISFAQAQGGPTCSVVTDTITPDCSDTGFLSGVPGFICGHKTVTCPTVGGVTFDNSFGITFGYLTPTSPKGTIVLFSNSGGVSPDVTPGAEKQFALAYYQQHYQVVETKWDSDWEDTGTSTKNIAYAAARPTAFLNWVRFGSASGGSGLWGTGGMCVHGTSAGSAAAAYALSWYGAGSFIDKVEMISGPPLSDIQQGCEVVSFARVVNVCNSGQFGCNPSNAITGWSVDPSYTDAKSSMRTWSDDATLGTPGVCRTSAGVYTSSTANAEWKNMSIVDGTVATFNYAKTNVTSWICANVFDQSDGLDDGVMNNSSPQAQLFFENFTSSAQIPQGLQINAVTGCIGDEGVAGGTPPANYSGTGMDAVVTDMTTGSNRCTAH